MSRADKRLVRVIKRQGSFRPGDIIVTTANTAALYVAQGFAVYEDEPTAQIMEPQENAMMPKARGRR